MSTFLRNGLMSATLIQFCSGGRDMRAGGGEALKVIRLRSRVVSHGNNFGVLRGINTFLTHAI